MRNLMAPAVLASVLFLHAPAIGADAPKVAQAPSPARADVATVKVHGTIDAIDKDKGTITLKGPKGRTITLDVQDKAKLDVVKVGDPVVATYLEALVVQLAKAGSTPGVSAAETRATSKPGENPAGAMAQQVTVTATIAAIDKKAQTVTLKVPGGGSETVKARDPKNLELVKVGDLVDITYTRALAVSLDKPAPAKK